MVSSLRQIVGRELRARQQRRRHNDYHRIFSQHDLLRATPNPRFLDEAREYWQQHYGKAGDPLWFSVCANVSGREDVRFVPHDIWFDEMLPYFNKLPMRAGYLDKNLPALLLGTPDAPITVLRRIHGKYYNSEYQRISRDDAIAAILAGGARQIVKPSLTDNGTGITPIEIVGEQIVRSGEVITLESLEQSHGGDFIVQEWIRQHPDLAAPHPSSVNTIRMVTFRWNDEIRVLLAYVRFGSHGKHTDNSSTGGVCCGIDDTGRLGGTAVDRTGAVSRYHPTTGYDFGTRVLVPNYQRVCQRAIEMHSRIWHFDLVSWDFAVAESGDPVFVEFNVRGTAFTYQFACGRPIFGDLTEEVLHQIRDCGGKRFGEGYFSAP